MSTHVETLPDMVRDAQVVFLDLGAKAVEQHAMTGPDLVHALRFLLPHLEILTYLRQDDVDTSIRMAELDVAWHFRTRPSQTALRTQIQRCADRAMARLARVETALRIDPSRRLAYYKSEMARFTPVEIAFLSELIRAKDSVIRRDDMVSRLWADNPPASDRAIDLVAFKVRRKLAQRFGFPNAIRSVRGIGYRLALPSHVQAVDTSRAEP